MYHRSNKGWVDVVFVSNTSDFFSVGLGVKTNGMPVNFRIRVAGITGKFENFILSVLRFLIRKNHALTGLRFINGRDLVGGADRLIAVLNRPIWVFYTLNRPSVCAE
jgi:hypothetical protein